MDEIEEEVEIISDSIFICNSNCLRSGFNSVLKDFIVIGSILLLSLKSTIVIGPILYYENHDLF